MVDSAAAPAPILALQGAGLTYGRRELWQNLNLTVTPGEFVAVLGPNGSGKTSLVKVLLGLTPLSSGTVQICGAPPTRGSSTIGYVPQQRGFDRDTPIRGLDLVRLGLDGHRWGFALPNRRRRQLVDTAIAAVGSDAYARSPIGLLSGGEQQRLRVAQALLGDPRLLLCDEALLSLDLKHQREVIGLIDSQRRAADIAVLFVTHEINPVLPVVDRILYVVGTRWTVGAPADILTSARLSDLYQTDIDVVQVGGRIIIVGVPDSTRAETGSTQYHHVPVDVVAR